jgi:beta-lactam-binding protein with PASTA domain
MDQRTAREAVANSGYRVGQVSVESTPSGSPYTAPLVVISQQPLAGTSTARGAEVDLVLGLQRE